MYDMKNLAKMKKLGELAPEAFKAFVAFDEAACKAGAIPAKYKELIAVAVALTTQCPYCIEIHSRRAKQAGNRAGTGRDNADRRGIRPGARSRMARTRWSDNPWRNDLKKASTA